MVRKNEGTIDPPRGGYDAPAPFQVDELERGAFAERIYEILVSAPLSWSVRIGIHGEWGAGKTTVLERVAALAADAGHIPVSLSPWRAQHRDELWQQFLAELFDALEKNGIEIPGGWWDKLIAKVGPFQKAVKKFAAEFPHATAPLNLAYMFVERALSPEGELFQKLTKSLGERRVIFVIDDLDRSDPSILPDLFLALRDVLDTPGFSYLLAFDPKIVSQALAQLRPEIGDGKEFLEKLLDFSFDLPSVTDKQVQHLLTSEFKRFCCFADLRAAEDLLDVLPRNPRKLKRFVRHVAVLEDQAARHDPDELRWPLIYLCQLLRLESECLLYELLGSLDEAAIEILGVLSDEEDKKRDYKCWVDQLIKKCGIGADRAEYAKRLATSLLRRSGLTDIDQIRYSAEIWIKPHAITWKEFREMFAQWRAESDAFDLNGWAEVQRGPISRVAYELFDTAHSQRMRSLEDAAGSRGADAHVEHVDTATYALDLTVSLYVKGLSCVGERYFRNAKCFEKIFGISVKWGHFDAQETDRALREREKEAIVRCVDAGIDDPAKALTDLYQQRRSSLWGETFDEFGMLCIPKFEKSVATDIVKRLEIKDGIAPLLDAEGHIAEHHLILNPDSLLWSDDLFAKARETLDLASMSPEIHENAYWLLCLIAQKAHQGSGQSRKVSVNSHADVVQAIWRAAISRPIQFRMRKGMRDIRNRLIANGIPNDRLPAPDWLEEPDEGPGSQSKD